MKYNTPESAYNQIKALGLPPIFDQIWRFQTPRRFCWLWTVPKMFFKFNGSAYLCPRAAESVPLLESNLDEAILFDPANAEYIHYYYGDRKVNWSSSSYQQLLSYIFLDLGESDLFDLVKEVAAEFGYKHLTELAEFLEEEEEDQALSWLDVKTKFIRSICD